MVAIIAAALRVFVLATTRNMNIRACCEPPVSELGQNSFTTFTDLVRKKMNNEADERKNPQRQRWKKEEKKRRIWRSRRENYCIRIVTASLFCILYSCKWCALLLINLAVISCLWWFLCVKYIFILRAFVYMDIIVF